MKIYRNLFCTACLLFTVSAIGCSSEPPAEATGDPVPENYEATQHDAAQKAMEAAKNGAKKK